MIEKDDEPKENEREVATTAAIESEAELSGETTESETTEDDKQDMDTGDKDFNYEEELESEVEDDIGIRYCTFFVTLLAIINRVSFNVYIILLNLGIVLVMKVYDRSRSL